MVVGQDGSNIEEIAEATEEEGDAETETIGDGTGPETDTGEGRVEGDVTLVDDMGIDLTGSTETRETVEHTGAEETDKGDEQELGDRRGIVRESPGADFQLLVHPRTARGRFMLVVFGVEGLGGDRSHLFIALKLGDLLVGRHCGELVYLESVSREVDEREMERDRSGCEREGGRDIVI